MNKRDLLFRIIKTLGQRKVSQELSALDRGTKHALHKISRRKDKCPLCRLVGVHSKDVAKVVDGVQLFALGLAMVTFSVAFVKKLLDVQEKYQ